MDCPICNNKSDVIDSVKNPIQKETYRKRKCKKCGNIFYSVEFEAIYDKRLASDWLLHHRKSGNKGEV